MDLFENIKIEDFGLSYNAYDPHLFSKNFYISDGQHYYWKNYNHVKLLDEAIGPIEAIRKGIPNIYIFV